MLPQDPNRLIEELWLRHQIEQWLYQEAALLDGWRLNEWLDLLTEDCRYLAPLRVNREGESPELSWDFYLFEDDKETLRLRVERLQTGFAWAEDPPSRTRHFVSNVRVTARREMELEVHSDFLVYRSRGAEAGVEWVAGERRDTLRQEGESFKLAQRIIIVDQASLNLRNLAFLL
ncbi:MAG: 3-phenylpropionate/cinnamic acid dioxygenase subunit beta [Firmicutes bacterium]|nr:3-phenylpropionate/cinnamic acid dioxygenase subunit beta [Bacillota bacterium]